MPAPELTLGLGQQSRPGFNWHGQVRVVTKQDRTADIFSGNTEASTDGEILSPGKGLIARLEGNF